MIATAEYTISKIYDGQPGQPGSPGASVSSITRYYTISTSPTQLINPSWADPDEPEWTTTQPSTDAIDETHYLWQKDVTTLSDGNTTIESNAWCERIISGIISQVNYDAGIISDRVWEDYTDTQIDAYDGSTTTTLGRKVSSMEQTVNGYDITVSGQTTHVDGLTERMTSAEGRLSVNENAITAMVTLDDQSSSLTLTNNMIEAMTNQFIVKSPDERRTIISGGKIATDAIKSNNYQAPTQPINGSGGTYPYSVSGSLFDLSDGKILTPYFALIPDSTGVTGTAYLNGTIETESGHIGGFVITENAIYHNKIDATSIDLSDDIYIINNDPYILDEEDYLYGGYASLYEVYMGIDGISCGFGKFAVDSTGELFASNATIKGNITATSGSFGTDNGYYKISDDGLIGYKLGTVYYYKIIPFDWGDTEHDKGSVKITGLTIETSTHTYSLSEILSMENIVRVGSRYEDDLMFITIETYKSIEISDLFDGTITRAECNFTYTSSGETYYGAAVNYDYQGQNSEIEDMISGTELGYDYLKTGKLIASDGLIIVDDNNQNAISITRSSVIVGNSLDDSKSSYIYIDSNDFTVFDSSHTEAFLVSSDGALLVTKKRIKKGLNISSYSASSSSPTTQTVTIDCVARNLPTESNSDAKITFEIVGKHVNDDGFFFFDTGLEVSLEDIKNAGSSGLDFHTSYYDDGWRIVFVYNNQSQIISVTTNITSEGQKWFQQIYTTLRSYSYTETTESMTPYFSIGSRKENTTLGGYSITGGYNIEASGNYSQAFGCGTIAQGAFQTVIGKYNLPVGTNDSVSNSVTNTDFAFMIGNGTSDNARTNAFAVDWNGTAHLRSIRSIRHSYVGPCPDADAYEEILVGNMTSRAQAVYSEPVDIAAWICATIIALCEDYPGKVQAIFKGRIVPNSAAYFEICIYDTNTTEIAYDYMPQYAYGVYRQWPNAYWIIWVDDYEFHYKAL